MLSPTFGKWPNSLSTKPPKLSASGQLSSILKNSSNFSFSIIEETIYSFSLIFITSSFFSS